MFAQSLYLTFISIPSFDDCRFIFLSNTRLIETNFFVIMFVGDSLFNNKSNAFWAAGVEIALSCIVFFLSAAFIASSASVSIAPGIVSGENEGADAAAAAMLVLGAGVLGISGTNTGAAISPTSDGAGEPGPELASKKPGAADHVGAVCARTA